MTIVTISRSSYCHGEEVAELAAELLGCECLAHEDVLEVARQCEVSEREISSALHDSPTFFERLGQAKEKILAHFRVELLMRLRADDIVYHGLAGHFLLGGVSHVLKVRVVAETEDRIHTAMEREGIGKGEAQRLIETDDREREAWSTELYGTDSLEPGLYDLMIRLGKVTPVLATSLICSAARARELRASAESRAAMEDLILAAEVKAALVDRDPAVEVSAEAGNVRVRTSGIKLHADALRSEVEEVAYQHSKVRRVEVEVIPEPRFA
jgi:cytidylate kinase